MEFIFIFFKNGITFLAQHEIFVWCGCFAVVFLCFLANLFCSPYGKYNRVLKKTNAYLKQCWATKTMPNMAKVNLPKQLSPDMENYLNSNDKFPGQMIKFVKLPFKTKGGFLTVFALSLAFVLLCEDVLYPFVPILLFVLSCLSQVVVVAVRDIRHRRASKITLQTTRLLDRLLGQSKMAKKQIELSDMCIDKEVDDVVEKINFFKQNGINEQTAKEIANLLSNDKLNKIRTQEQQKKLNLALNGLLQVMSKKQQEKQVG